MAAEDNVINLTPLLSSHEQRLQSMEKVVSDTAQGVIEVRGEVTHLGERMSRENEIIIEKMQEGFKSIHAHLAHLPAISAKLSEHEAALTKLKASEHARKAKIKKVRNWMIGTAVTGVGAVLAKFGTMFMLWMGLK